MKVQTTYKVVESTERFPVYCQYSGQHQPQNAYISLDLENGEVDAFYNTAIGGGCSEAVWNRRVLTFSINPETHRDEIKRIIEVNIDTFQKILDGSEVVWDGSNWVGKLNCEAQDLYEEWEYMGDFDNKTSIITQNCFSDFLADRYPENMSMLEFANEINECDGENGCWFKNKMDDEEILRWLEDEWANDIYNGCEDDMPLSVLNHMASSDKCDHYADEIKEAIEKKFK